MVTYCLPERAWAGRAHIEGMPTCQNLANKQVDSDATSRTEDSPRAYIFRNRCNPQHDLTPALLYVFQHEFILNRSKVWYIWLYIFTHAYTNKHTHIHRHTHAHRITQTHMHARTYADTQTVFKFSLFLIWLNKENVEQLELHILIFKIKAHNGNPTENVRPWRLTKRSQVWLRIHERVWHQLH